MQKLLVVLAAVVAVVLCEDCPKCPESLEIREVTVCELDRKHIWCPQGTKIHIHEAFYGRRNTFTCRQQAISKGRAVGGVCSSPKTLEVLSKRCNGKGDCNLYAHNSMFTDPCRTGYKYLEVSYSCL